MSLLKRTFLIMVMLFSGFAAFPQTDLPLDITVTPTLPTCGINNDGAITCVVNNGTAPYVYEWYRNFAQTLFSNSQDLTGLSVGYYTVKVVDANGNIGYGYASLSHGLMVECSSTSANCPQSDGALTTFVTGGTPPYNYLWSTGATTSSISGLAAGDYSVVITDANGCQAVTDTIPTVRSNSSLSLSTYQENEVCNDHLGSATVSATGGVAPYSYYWNSTPAQTTAQATDLSSGYYMVTVTDQQGCFAEAYVYISLVNGSLSASISGTDASCTNNDGSASVSVSGGIPPYTYRWNTNETTSSISNLERGWYWVRIQDAGNCYIDKSIWINNASTINIGFSSTPAQCNHTGGALSTSVVGGSGSYSYLWSNGSTSANLSNLSEGCYSVLVTDNNTGCKSTNWSYVRLSNSCWNSISGNIYQDNNGNCIQDAGDDPIVNTYVYSTNGMIHWGKSNNIGQYTISAYPNIYDLTTYYEGNRIDCPSGGSYHLDGTAGGMNFTGQDFGLTPPSYFQDIWVYTFDMTEARPGFLHTYAITFGNKGTVPVTGSIEFTYDNQEVFSSATVIPSSHTGNILSFPFSNLLLGETRTIYVTMQVPIPLPLGTQLYTTTVAESIANDQYDYDNTYENSTVVIGSYDPNDIQVFPKGAGNEGSITQEDSILTYLIRFQNTGTASAILVRVFDTLDVSKLDLNTIHNVSSSHTMEMYTYNNSVLEFRFPNIYLPDSTYDEPNSHGFVTFKIKLKKDLPIGTDIYNEANIYFDYNVPVETNTAQNRISAETSVTEMHQQFFSVYPNPADQNIQLDLFNAQHATVQVTNITGIEVLKIEGYTSGETIDLTELPKGVYFCKVVYSDGRAGVERIVRK